MSEALKLLKTKHPHKDQARKFDLIFGLDQHKKDLLAMLRLLLQPDYYNSWRQSHHNSNKLFSDENLVLSPLIIFSGDVGCGKTELAQAVATPLAHLLGGQLVNCFETPSDIRGGGHVGELSLRITAAFNEVKVGIPNNQPRILIIDEGDDLATSREQNQAHHEDRAGVNVLIKELERLAMEKVNVAVILITNRITSLDPAVVRRATLHLEFNRPKPEDLKPLFKTLLEGTESTESDIEALVQFSATVCPPFNFSDIRRRAYVSALMTSIQENRPFGAVPFLEALKTIKPSPTFNSAQ